MIQAMGMANRLMLQLIRNQFGVDKVTLLNMVKLKTLLVNELDREPDEQFLIDLEDQLTALANNHDRETKEQERIKAREVFCMRGQVPIR